MGEAFGGDVHGPGDDDGHEPAEEQEQAGQQLILLVRHVPAHAYRNGNLEKIEERYDYPISKLQFKT